MTELVERTCTEIKIGASQAETERTSMPLEELRDAAAYVLLGPPGSGKTKEFERQARIRYRALDAFVRQRGERAKALANLRGLAASVYEGAISDPNDDLLGSLLDILYPEALTESEILGYLRAPKRPDQILSYEYFWRRQLANRSSCDQVARMLDDLVDMRESLLAEAQKHDRRENTLRRVPAILLDRFLTSCKEEPDPQRLFKWLGVAGWVDDWNVDLGVGLESSGRIGAWIGERPELWKSLMALALKHCIDSMAHSNGFTFDHLIEMERERRVFSAPLPLDFASWCLEQALGTQHRTAATWLMYRVAEALHRDNGNEILRKAVDARIAGNDLLSRALEERLDVLEKYDEAERKSRDRPARRVSDRQLEWQALVNQHEVELRENRASRLLLYKLAKAYLGGFGNVIGRTPRDRLSNLLGGDKKLVDTVLAGLSGTLTREDLPTVDEVIRLGPEDRIHYLSIPFMAGLNELLPSKSVSEFSLDEKQTRLALAIHYNVALWIRSSELADKPPHWLEPLLWNRPELVAEVLVRTAKSRLRKGRDFSQHLYDLAHSAEHKAVARRASLPILSAFPVRCAERQLPSLRHVLLASCLYCGRETLVALIEKKLACRSMNVAQRVYWLAGGLIVHPQLYLARLESFVAGNERRVWQLGRFLSGRLDTPDVLIQRLDVAALSVLIRVIGAMHRPYSLDSDSDEGCIVTPGMEAADRVHGLINQLASDPFAEASEHLEGLSVNHGLFPWRSHLIDAASRQNAIRRDASFRYADVSDVVEVLGNKEPANIADLAAVTLQHLREIARLIRDGNTSDWRQYWKFDSRNRAERPRWENDCRDALLSDLQQRLRPLGIDAQPEGYYADDKRADIRISYKGFNIPLEIKRSCHRDLWSAIRKQLIAKYTRDPDADGHGIYLFFWFGDSEHCKPTPGIAGTPKSALEVEERLLADLSAEQRTKISICSIDGAVPHR